MTASSDRPGLIGRLAVGAAVLLGSVLLGALVGAAGPADHR